MRTADLCDLTDLVGGFETDLRRRYGLTKDATDISKDISVPEDASRGASDSIDDRQFANESPPLSITAAVLAIDAVTRVYPLARWTVSGDMGRITAGDVLVSLAMSLTDPDAETAAWLDAGQRLGDGRQYR